MSLQFRRGPAAEKPLSAAAGEPLFTTDTNELWVGTGSSTVKVSGMDGDDGREVEFRTSATHIQWRYVGDQAWQDLVDLSTLEGPAGPQGTGINILGSFETQGELPPSGEVGDAYLVQGDLFVWGGSEWVNAGNIQGPAGAPGAPGTPGTNGREIELRKTNTHIQWKYADESTWTDLVALSEITGPQGVQGPQGIQGNQGIQGIQGPPGADAQLPAATQGETGYLKWDGAQWIFQSDGDGGGPQPPPSDAGYEVVGFWNTNGDPFSGLGSGGGFTQVAVVDQTAYPDSDIGVPTTTGGVTSFENPVDLLTWTNPLSSNAYRYLAYRWLGAVGDEPDPAWELTYEIFIFGGWGEATPHQDLGLRTFTPVGESTPVTYRLLRMDESQFSSGQQSNLPERIS